MASRRLQILSIASACPFPPEGGTRILIYQQVRELAHHHDVDLVMVDCPNGVACDVGGLVFCRSTRLVAIPQPERRFSFAEKIAVTIRRRVPFFMYQRYSNEAQIAVDRLARRHPYDVVVAEDNEAALYVRSTYPGVKVLTKHSILSTQRTQLARTATSRLTMLRDRIYAALLRAHERREARRFDLIKLPTHADRRQWTRLASGAPGRAPLVITNGVDTSYFQYSPRRGPVDRLIFTANFAGVQNVDAVSTFIDHVYPRVLAEIGRVPLYVVGKSPPASLRARASDLVTITGSVPDVRPYYGSKAIAIVPLRIASGIINKVLEPMALGVAVVATPVAVEGLDADARALCMVAEEPAEFADAIARLYRDDALYERLTTAAHAHVQLRHSWSALMAEYRHAIEAIAAEAGGPRESGAASQAAARAMASDSCPSGT